jgi:hypothetical protein
MVTWDTVAEASLTHDRSLALLDSVITRIASRICVVSCDWCDGEITAEYKTADLHCTHCGQPTSDQYHIDLLGR